MFHNTSRSLPYPTQANISNHHTPSLISGVWFDTTTNPYQVTISPNFNPVTGQFLPTQTPEMHGTSGVRLTQPEGDRNEKMQQLGVVSYYADAVLKGPRL